MVLPYETLEEIDIGTVYRGDTIELPEMEALDRDGLPIDLNGATIWFTAKNNLSLDDAVAPGFQVSTLSSGVTITDPDLGLYQVTIPPSATAMLEQPTVFTWDVQVSDAGGVKRTVARGTMKVVLDVTKA